MAAVKRVSNWLTAETRRGRPPPLNRSLPLLLRRKEGGIPGVSFSIRKMKESNGVAVENESVGEAGIDY